MFDIGFWELGIIAVVALLVIGPERLPSVARAAGKWIGTAKRFVNNVQADINTEFNKADELKRLLEEQSELKSVHEILETNVSPDDTERKPIPREKKDYLVKAAPDEEIETVPDISSDGDQEKQKEKDKKGAE